MKSVASLCLILILISCGDKSEKAILPPEKMGAVLFDFAMAEAYTNTHVNIDSVLLAQTENVKLQKRIFAIHGITREEFKQSFDYYTRHASEFTPILDSVAAKENRLNTAPVNNKYE